MSSQQTVKKRLKYSPTKMAAAIEMVKTGVMSKRKASLTYGVPRTTLLDKIAGRVPEDRTPPGSKPVLTSTEETVLADYVKLMASIGYPLSREELLIKVKKILDLDGRNNPFKDNKPGKDWFYAFKRRHPDVSERAAMNLGHQRAIVNKAMIEGWYSGLFEHLTNEVPDHENLVKDPRRVFNTDESGFPLCFKTGEVLASKGAPHVYNVTTSNKQQITVMVCFNAFGDYLPPLIVYPGQRFRDTGISDFPQATYGHSDNGWIDKELFVSWLQQFDSFVTEKQITKPVLLFVDGHSTHMTRSAAKFCADKEIILYCLLANATHILQPCDVGFFSPMKSAWKRSVKVWQLDNIGEGLTKQDFPKVFKKAWDCVATTDVAIHGFKRAGLFPLDAKLIDESKLKPSTVANPVNNVVIIKEGNNLVTAAGDNESNQIDNPEQEETEQQAISTSDSDLKESNVSSVPKHCSEEVCKSRDTEPRHSSIEIDKSPLPRPDNVVKSQTSSGYVSPAFALLKVPEPKQRKRPVTLNSKLPKCITGKSALDMFAKREKEKEEELEKKRKRKEEREVKRKEKEKVKEQKRKEREARKLKRKTNKKRQRKDTDSSSSDEDRNNDVKVEYMETDDSYDESKFCPGCRTDDTSTNDDEWIKCIKCPRMWHVSCTVDDLLLEILLDQLKNYPFHCEYCL